MIDLYSLGLCPQGGISAQVREFFCNLPSAGGWGGGARGDMDTLWNCIIKHPPSPPLPNQLIWAICGPTLGMIWDKLWAIYGYYMVLIWAMASHTKSIKITGGIVMIIFH